MTDRELMQMALDAFEKIVDGCQNVKKANPMHESARDLATFVIVDCKAPIKSISARLAQPEHGDGYRWREGDVPPSMTYTAPPQREWQGLTDEEIHSTNGYEEDRKLYRFARAIEAKLKEKNHG